MYISDYLLATVKEIPADAETISHQLMIRAGLIRKVAAGLYTWLPMGLRVLRKVERIVREEMDNAGALELLMPAVQPAELWEETHRWDQFGPQLLKMTDRHERSFCFGPTHEEVITDLARKELRSYKQLPLNFYQIQLKFRDEIRPRFGVMRAREFLMKDAYSFHIDHTSLQTTYDRMYAAYQTIFTRIGLNFRAVLADTGSIGGSGSHEFHVLASAGEDQIFFSDQSDYAANIELAEALAPMGERPAPDALMESVETPEKNSIEDVCEFLQCSPTATLKTLLVKGTETPVIGLLLRGDHELNTIKAEKIAGVFSPLTFAEPAEIAAIVSCEVGSIGPVGLSIPLIVDRSAAHLANFICGANVTGQHLRHVNWIRDLPLPTVADIRNVVVGDPSPDGKGHLQMARGIEVGHIFQLGTKYSAAMNAMVLNEQGKNVVIHMGCYGIGVSRIVAAAIEQYHDARGIIWPPAIAPFQVILLPMNAHKCPAVAAAAEALYHTLNEAGFEVLFDDRKERPGVMFADAELLGIPHRLVIGEAGLENNTLEYRGRSDDENTVVPLNEVIDFLQTK